MRDSLEIEEILLDKISVNFCQILLCKHSFEWYISVTWTSSNVAPIHKKEDKQTIKIIDQLMESGVPQGSALGLSYFQFY